MRGAIMATDENGSVRFLNPEGETKTYTKNEYDYAGSASGAPAVAAGAKANDQAVAVDSSKSKAAKSETTNASTQRNTRALTNDRESEVRLTSNIPNVTFFVKSSESTVAASGFATNGMLFTVTGTVGTFNRLCSAPCTANLRNGTYLLGLSLDGGEVVPVSSSVTVNQYTTLNGNYSSNFTARLVTRIAGTGLLVGGVILTFIGLSHEEKQCFGTVCTDTIKADSTQVFAGVTMAVVGVCGLIVAQWLLTDSAEIEVSQRSATLKKKFIAPGLFSQDSSGLPNWQAQGVTLGGVFLLSLAALLALASAT